MFGQENTAALSKGSGGSHTFPVEGKHTLPCQGSCCPSVWKYPVPGVFLPSFSKQGFDRICSKTFDSTYLFAPDMCTSRVPVKQNVIMPALHFQFWVRKGAGGPRLPPAKAGMGGAQREGEALGEHRARDSLAPCRSPLSPLP